jgi:hypothetical protein
MKRYKSSTFRARLIHQRASHAGLGMAITYMSTNSLGLQAKKKFSKYVLSPTRMSRFNIEHNVYGVSCYSHQATL